MVWGSGCGQRSSGKRSPLGRFHLISIEPRLRAQVVSLMPKSSGMGKRGRPDVFDQTARRGWLPDGVYLPLGFYDSAPNPR